MVPSNLGIDDTTLLKIAADWNRPESPGFWWQ
jgi:hypothetical protein